MKQSTQRIMEEYGEEFVQFFRNKLYELTHLPDTNHSYDDFIYSCTRKELGEMLYDSFEELGKDQFIKFHSILHKDDYGQTHSLRKLDRTHLKHASENMNRVLIVPVGQHAQVAYIQNSEEAHQWLVDGRKLDYVQYEDVVMVMDKHRNESYRINRRLDSKHIIGNFIIMGMDDTGFIDLTDEQIEKYMQLFYEPKHFSTMEFEDITRLNEEHFF